MNVPFLQCSVENEHIYDADDPRANDNELNGVCPDCHVERYARAFGRVRGGRGVGRLQLQTMEVKTCSR